MSQGFDVVIAKVREAGVPGAGYKGGLKIESSPCATNVCLGQNRSCEKVARHIEVL